MTIPPLRSNETRNIILLKYRFHHEKLQETPFRPLLYFITCSTEKTRTGTVTNGWNFHFSTQTYYLSVKFLLKYKDRNRLKLFVWSLIMYHSFDQVTYIMLYRWFMMHVKNYSISFPFWCGSGLAIVLQREHMAGNTRKDRNLRTITNYLF